MFCENKLISCLYIPMRHSKVTGRDRQLKITDGKICYYYSFGGHDHPC